MIKVVFFAQLKEILGVSSVNCDIQNMGTVDDVFSLLSEQLDNWQGNIEKSQCLCAVNHTLVDFEHPVKSGDEVAFFPPVTGG